MRDLHYFLRADTLPYKHDFDYKLHEGDKILFEKYITILLTHEEFVKLEDWNS